VTRGKGAANPDDNDDGSCDAADGSSSDDDGIAGGRRDTLLALAVALDVALALDIDIAATVPAFIGPEEVTGAGALGPVAWVTMLGGRATAAAEAAATAAVVTAEEVDAEEVEVEEGWACARTGGGVIL
jgi:hypothetical protein